MVADCGATSIDWHFMGSASTWSITTRGINFAQEPPTKICEVLSREVAPKTDSVKTQIDKAFFYAAGCSNDVVANTIACEFKSIYPNLTEVEVASDMLGAARGLCGAGRGIVAILGTGSNSCYYDGNKIVGQIPSLGFILGDEGSGAVIGRNFLNMLFKHRLPSEVRREFMERMPNLRVDDVIANVYRQPRPSAYLGSLMPHIRQVSHHKVVADMIKDEFRRFLRYNVLPYDVNLPVNFTGSVAWYFAHLLLEAAEAEGVEVGKIEQSPVNGLLKYHSSHSE